MERILKYAKLKNGRVIDLYLAHGIMLHIRDLLDDEGLPGVMAAIDLYRHCKGELAVEDIDERSASLLQKYCLLNKIHLKPADNDIRDVVLSSAVGDVLSLSFKNPIAESSYFIMPRSIAPA